MPISLSGQRDEVNETSYLSSRVSVSTTEVEAKAGVSRLSSRQEVLLYNDSAITVYFGPSGVSATGTAKGVPLESGDSVSLTIGDVGIFLITASGTASVIVQEYS